MVVETQNAGGAGVTRRDFLHVATGTLLGVGTVLAAWPFIDQMQPSADVKALATVEVDLSPIATGQAIKVMWRGKPVFIRHRTEKEIAEARAVDLSKLRDPEPDQARVHEGEAQWLILIGVCTHLGCVPLGTLPGEPRGEYDGWFCPCHGSHYDSSGRIRKGPAPKNLEVPFYRFADNGKIVIGREV
ncbi:MAG: ubiquinol-cytochrome c reductase iron-sulfur subunit [Alphaproteobacteria bacterium]|nr:MAG: ubiquinol-cytochrome c reductase iron-sulfur subunit [Alphaproteobacteria bacterium]